MASVKESNLNIIKETMVVVKHLIGTGTFGKVYYGKLRLYENEIEVAVKKPNEKVNNSQISEEISISNLVSHENLVKLIGVIHRTQVDERPWLVLEYMAYGTVAEFLNRFKKFRTSNDFKLDIAKSVATGMKYLHHDMEIVHADLHICNCFVTHGPEIKIGDFGFSFKITESEANIMNGLVGRSGRPEGSHVFPCNGVRWKAPECLRGKNFRRAITRAGDVWSFGVLLFQVFNNGVRPFQLLNTVEASEEVAKGRNPLMHYDGPEGSPGHIHDLMLKCFKYAPVDRPTFLTILNELKSQ